MNSMVFGMGEVGKAVYEVTGSTLSFSLDDPKGQESVWEGDLDVMHICFPYSETFVEDVQRYIKNFEPLHIIVWSTVPIGTCRKIDERVVHMPVEGMHPHLERSIRLGVRWIGYNRGDEARFVDQYFLDLGCNPRSVQGTEVTELLKLRSTARFGIDLVWAQYEAELCKQYNIGFDQVQDYDIDYNDLYAICAKLADGESNNMQPKRHVLYPPEGEIGGHCVVPNAKLLNQQFPSDLLDKIIAMEKK